MARAHHGRALANALLASSIAFSNEAKLEITIGMATHPAVEGPPFNAPPRGGMMAILRSQPNVDDLQPGWWARLLRRIAFGGAAHWQREKVPRS